MAKIDFVIEIDGGDHGEGWVDHVGGVQTPTHADFDDSGVYVELSKQPERHRRDGFEVGRVAIEVKLFRSLMHHREGALKLFRCHGDSRDLNAFGRFDQMGGGEQACSDGPFWSGTRSILSRL